jgi:hypothetical protein
VARSLTKPPTEAEVAAEWHDRVQRTARHEQPQHARDLEWAGVVERQQELARTVPTSSVAWQICKGYWLGATPLDPTTLQPIGEPLLDPVSTVDYWTQHCDAAVGVRLGPVRGGTMALLG